jgi:hypothetical protein
MSVEGGNMQKPQAQRPTRATHSLIDRARAAAQLPAAACCGAALALGCSAQSLDLGAPQIAIDRSALSSYTATWAGYAEAFQFASGSDRVAILIDTDGTGHMKFGDGTPPPAPTAADDPLPGVDASGAAFKQAFTEGFSYSVSGAKVEEERIRVSARSAETYDTACELQTSYQDAQNPGRFACLPNVGAKQIDGHCFLADEAQTPVSCGQLLLCIGLGGCACDANGCTGASDLDIAFDGALDEEGTHLVGTLRIPWGSGDPTVRLTKQQL